MKKTALRILLALAVLFIVPGITFSGSGPTWISGSFDNPKTRTDGTAFNPLTDEFGYNMYYGTVNPPVTKMTVTFTPGYPAVVTGQTFTITGLSPNTAYYVSVSVLDFYGNESTHVTPAISKTTGNYAPPGGCTNLQ